MQHDAVFTETHCDTHVFVHHHQASEMASFVQAKRDLGCKAPQVTLLEEGINTDSRWAKEFWSLLGGKAQYRGLYITDSV